MPNMDETLENIKLKKGVGIPNCFILGAPKSGTTAMAKYLGQHPDVYISYPKEPNFFNTDFTSQYRVFHDLGNYLNTCFENAEGYKIRGEATVWYLYSKDAVNHILRLFPEAKFIVMLRNPLEMAPSLHAMEYRVGHENIQSFEKAWELQESRQNGENLPPNCPDPQLYQYGTLCKIGEQMKRLMRMVPSERLCIIWFDDFRSNTLAAYQQVLSFLGLPYDGKTAFPVVNEAKEPRSSTLAVLMAKLGPMTGWQKFKRRMGIRKGVSPIRYLKEKNLKASEKQKLSDELLEKLSVYFRQDIALLEKLSGRDLSDWKK